MKKLFFTFSIIIVLFFSFFARIIYPIKISNTNNNNFLINTSSIINNNYAIISDDINLWNNESSVVPDIAIGNDGKIHVVWNDHTNGPWGSNSVIMYASKDTSGWSNATIISEGVEDQFSPKIAVDSNRNVHIVWANNTQGIWGNGDIFYRSYTPSQGWSEVIILSNESATWDNDNNLAPDLAVDPSDNLHIVWQGVANGGLWGSDDEILYITKSGQEWSNITIISDDSDQWNDGDSRNPSIALDSFGNDFVVWQDNTVGTGWGADWDIMFRSKTPGASVWSDVRVISDDTHDWNNDNSIHPVVAASPGGGAYFVWEDDTDGVWGTDKEIMYVYNSNSFWSNATVISDDITKWNNDGSSNPDIVLDSDNKIHVIWEDDTDGGWGADKEIMSVSSMDRISWSTITIISDDSNLWNNGDSNNPAIAAGKDGSIHIVWDDDTNGVWGNDKEIIYRDFPGSNQNNTFPWYYIVLIAIIVIIGVGTVIYLRYKK